jgi:gas vesicle protein
MAKTDNSGAILLAFVAGAIAGAAVALLYAPATGEETRDFIGQRAREGREKVVDAARQFRAATEPEA